MAPTRPASARPSDKDEYAENPLARRRGARAERPERRAIGPESRRHRRRRRRLELTEKSYAALTVDNDARRSGVHQTTIYRRWKDRESLVAGAEADLAAPRLPFPDAGDIDADFRELAVARQILQQPDRQAILAAIVSDAARIPEIPRRNAASSRTASVGPGTVITSPAGPGHARPVILADLRPATVVTFVPTGVPTEAASSWLWMRAAA